MNRKQHQLPLSAQYQALSSTTASPSSRQSLDDQSDSQHGNRYENWQQEGLNQVTQPISEEVIEIEDVEDRHDQVSPQVGCSLTRSSMGFT
jgi:hypothetical protein